MEREIYADQVSNISVTGNVVRLDFASLNPLLQDKQGQPVYNLAARIVIPLEGFTKAFNIQQEVIAKLMAGGLVKVNQPSGAAGETPAAAGENAGTPSSGEAGN
jgi:hypothetical protein